MPRSRPQLSITLPRNFTFHYTEDDPPKTPEREVPAPQPRSPHAEGVYRIRRRSRAALSSVFESSSRALPSSSETAIPTIETPLHNNLANSLHPLFGAGTSEGYLAPIARKVSTLPRTPTARQSPAINEWETQQDLGESIARPLSACSLLSDSSDASNGSLTSFPAGDGSCTSPESDAPDPFASRFSSIKRSRSKLFASLVRNEESVQKGLSTRQMNHVRWTPDMDKHLWSTYLLYLQDPTVTPFKMLPGSAPPLGVCHRVAREARRSWRGGRAVSNKPASLLSPFSVKNDDSFNSAGNASVSSDSPDTIRATRSGSNTPTKSSQPRNLAWPKSGSSTRRRLRHLCRSKPSIAPHYQRLMQSRSPSPFSSSPHPQSRTHSRLSEMTNSSPFGQASSSFNTRDVQVSLTTSTAASMQPDGPLAQMTAGDQLPPSQPTIEEGFVEPPVPFASEPAIPSELSSLQGNQDVQTGEALDLPRLGSPFGFHTWGPSQSKQRLRPSPSRIQSNEETILGPSLRSPVRMHDTFPSQGVHKRRAMASLEDELSPNGSTMQQALLENLFGTPAEGRHRRVRSRGFSLGDVSTPNPLETLFTPPPQQEQTATDGAMDMGSSDSVEPPTPTAQIRRLGSPFHGISPRPTRSKGPSRHVATTSLGTYDVGAFSSIGETLGQASSSQPFGPQ